MKIVTFFARCLTAFNLFITVNKAGIARFPSGFRTRKSSTTNPIRFLYVKAQTSPLCEVAFAYLSEPRENLGGNLEWTIGVKLKEDEMIPLMDICNEEIKEKQKAGKLGKELGAKFNWPYRTSQKKEEDGSKTVVDGEFLWVFKRKVVRKIRGEESRNMPPSIFDGMGHKVANPPQIGGGSKVKIIFTPYAYDNVQKGVQFQLQAVQIVELKEVATLEIAPVEGGWQAPDAGGDSDFAAMFAGSEVA